MFGHVRPAALLVKPQRVNTVRLTLAAVYVFTPKSLTVPGTCVDSVITRMSLTYSLAKAEKTGSSPHSMDGGSSAGSIAARCMSWWKIYVCFRGGEPAD